MKFNLDIRKLAGEIEEHVVEVQKKLALQLLQGVVDMNPVLTGRSRGNWQVTIGTPAKSALDVEDKDGGPTKAAGEGVINQLTTLGAIYLTNNVPYITELERGSSKQAPSGMVQVTLDRLLLQF